MIDRLKNWLLDYNIKVLTKKHLDGKIGASSAEELKRMLKYKEKGYW